jgi:ribonuclease HI
VKAHAGLEGNEIADELAKAGTTSAYSLISPGASGNWVKNKINLC